MTRLYQTWHTERRGGDLIMVAYLLAQCLDGVFTYMGVSIWGLEVEANPVISSAVAFAGPGTGLMTAKLAAAGFGMLLHLQRVHGVVALLTMFYLVVAILPWTALFLGH